MKEIILFVLLVTLSYSTNGQIPKYTDFKLLAGQATDYGNGIKVDNNGNYYLTASSHSPLNSFIINQPLPPDICNFIPPVKNTIMSGILLRYDSDRNLNLSIAIENSSLGEFVIDSLGNIYISGAFQYGASRDGFIKKFSSSGDLIWTKLVQSYSSSGNEDAVITSLDMFTDGSLIMCGFTYGRQVEILGKEESGPNNFLTKFNTNGEVIWTKKFSSDLGMGASKVRYDKAGNIVITGSERVTNSNNLATIIAKIENATGDIIWKKSFVSTGSQYITQGTTIAASDSFYTVGGIFGGQLAIEDKTLISAGGLDVFLLQCDTSGNIHWIKSAGSAGRETIYDLLTDAKGNSYLTGGFSSGFKFNESSYASKGFTDVYIGSIDRAGTTLWMLTGGSNIPEHTDDIFFDELGASIALDSRKQVQIIGNTIGSGNFGGLKYNAPEEVRLNAFWLTLGSKSSNYTIQYPCDNTSVIHPTNSVFVHPNPFLDNLTITNLENKPTDYKIMLYNSLGQKIDGQYYPNSSTITITSWNNLAAGIYLLRIDTGVSSNTFKLIKE